MAYDSVKPADNDFLADFPPQMREQLRAIINDCIVNAMKLQGLVAGNTAGQIPINNNTVCTNLNADKVDGKDADYFSPATHTHNNATQSSAGLQSAQDKTKLDGVAVGAEVNQNAFSNVLVGGTAIQADSKTDTLEIISGKNIAITPDATNDRITIALDGKVDNAINADKAAECTGNAATATKFVDGKSSADFAPSGYGVGGYCKDLSGVSNLDLDNLYVGGNYTVRNVLHAPNNITEYLYVSVLAYHQNWVIQVAYEFYSNNNGQKGRAYLRQRDVGTWTAWKQLATVDQIPASLPANGGNSDTVDGLHASNFVSSDNSNSIITSARNAADINDLPRLTLYNPDVFFSDIILLRNGNFTFRQHNDKNAYVGLEAGQIKSNGKQVATIEDIPNPSNLLAEIVVQSDCTEVVLQGLNVANATCILDIDIINRSTQRSFYYLTINDLQEELWYTLQESGGYAGAVGNMLNCINAGLTNHMSLILSHINTGDKKNISVNGQTMTNNTGSGGWFPWSFYNTYAPATTEEQKVATVNSIKIYSNVANAIGKGSIVRLYKRR